MANGSGQRERGIAAQAEREARARSELARLRRRLSWKAGHEIARRLEFRPDEIETTDLVRIAKLDATDTPKTLTLQGDAARPLIIGLEPARDSLARAAEAPVLPRFAPTPELTDSRGQLKPQRLTLPPTPPTAAPDGE